MSSKEKRFWSGNIALAEGALAAGVDFYAGYPITPSSEIMEHMARELPKRGGVFLQAEDEIASIFMLIGASWADAKPMTATSGPGFSLMQEGLGIAVMTETPLLVVDVMRVGPGTGQASKAAQGDLLQARWGRHGDQIIPVFAPSSAQDCFDLAIFAVNTAEKLRTPVILLSDELLAHTWEAVEVPEEVERAERRRPAGKEPPFGSEDPAFLPPCPAWGKGTPFWSRAPPMTLGVSATLRIPKSIEPSSIGFGRKFGSKRKSSPALRPWTWKRPRLGS